MNIERKKLLVITIVYVVSTLGIAYALRNKPEYTIPYIIWILLMSFDYSVNHLYKAFQTTYLYKKIMESE